MSDEQRVGGCLFVAGSGFGPSWPYLDPGLPPTTYLTYLRRRVPRDSHLHLTSGCGLGLPAAYISRPLVVLGLEMTMNVPIT